MVKKLLSNTKILFLFSILIVIFLGSQFAAGLNYHSIIPLLAFAVDLNIAVFVYSKDTKRKLYQVFALWNITFALHSLLVFGLYVAPSPSFAKTWTKITGIGYYLLPATYLHFTLVFTKSKSWLKRIMLLASYGVGIVLAILAFVPPFENEYIKVGIKFSPKATLTYAVSMIVLFVVCTSALIHVCYAFVKSSSRHERNQYKYFLFASGVALSIGTTNYMVSYGIKVYPLASVAFTACGLILAYAILRHRFLDIEIIVRKSIIYASLTVCVAGGYAGVMVVANTVFSIASPATSVPLNAAVIVAIAFFFHPLRVRIQAFVDRRFFRDKYDYRKTLRRFSDEIATTVGIEDISLRLVNIITSSMKVDRTALVLFNQESGVYETVAEKRFGQDGHFFPLGFRKEGIDSRLTIFLREQKRAVDTEELGFMLESSPRTENREISLKLVESLKKSQAEVAIPILTKNMLRGAFIVGSKLSEEGYSAEDIELLKIIVNQAAIAIENSELYDMTLSMKRYYDDIIRSLTTGMLTVDAREKVVTLNEAGEKILGLRADDIKKRNIADVFEDNQEFAKAILDTIRSGSAGETSYNETELTYQDETEKRLVVTTSLLRDRTDETVGVVALFNDVTEKKELEKQVERNKRLAYMGEMAASIAHEIKNPIGSIRLFVDALSRDFSDPVAQKNFKEVIPQEVENIDMMVKELLFLARPSSLTKVELDLSEIVHLSVRLCSEDASTKNVSLEAKLPGRPVRIVADGEKLKQALRNIILNAIDAVSPGDGEVTVSLESDNNGTRVIVNDNGPGIPEDIASRLFQPFFTTKHQGTGLGLAIANKIVEDHGGTIEVNSKENTGTTFTIRLTVKTD